MCVCVCVGSDPVPRSAEAKRYYDTVGEIGLGFDRGFAALVVSGGLQMRARHPEPDVLGKTFVQESPCKEPAVMERRPAGQCPHTVLELLCYTLDSLDSRGAPPSIMQASPWWSNFLILPCWGSLVRSRSSWRRHCASLL